MKLLIVDDSGVIRRVLENHLTNIIPDSTFVQAADGVEGLQKLKSNPDIDIVFLDVNMPNMKGDEMLAKMRNIPEYNKIRVIMATTEAQKKDVIRIMKIGANGYLVKPFQAESITKSLQPILAKMGIDI